MKSEHLSSSLVEGCSAYFWIESGTCSYPLDAWNFPVPTAGYLIDSHQHPALSLLQAALFDVVFVAQRPFLTAARQVNANSHWLPLAAPSWFLEQAPQSRRYDIGFVGSLSQSASRRALLMDLQERFSTNKFDRQYSVEEMAAIYGTSHCVVNPPVSDDLNMRFFEAMACGAAVITPTLDNGMSDVAIPDRHFKVADFRDIQSVASVVADLIRTGEARAVGESARELVRRRHTYEHRLSQVVDQLATASMTSPIRGASTKERSRHMLVLAESVRDMKLVTSAVRCLGLDRKVPKVVGHVAAASLRRGLRSG